MCNAASSSQDSDSSDDPIMPSVHKTLIKPKFAASPVINNKATAMMASLIIFSSVLLLMNIFYIYRQKWVGLKEQDLVRNPRV
jgi:hypothetical protein